MVWGEDRFMNFAIFIISHERADRVETYNTLKRGGYTGQIFVVIDNKDSMLRKYLARFGDDVLVFDKEVYAERTDTLETAKLKASAVYARNAVEDFAQMFELDAFGVFDDDITGLRYRWEEDNKYKSLKVNGGLDDVVSYYCDYLVQHDIATMSFENCMFYLGGVTNDKVSNERWTYQIHFRNIKFPVDWISIINEDIITEITTAVKGYIWWSLPHIVYEAVDMNDLSGGVKNLYDNLNKFYRAFLGVISNPSSCKVGYSHGKIRILQNKSASYPMIVSGEYKK